MDHYFLREEGVGNFETNMHNLSIRKKFMPQKIAQPPTSQGKLMVPPKYTILPKWHVL